jgi:hypothetical protein
MTEGAVQAKKLEPYANRLKRFAFPTALVTSIITYLVIYPNIYFCLSVFFGLLAIAIDEYWQTTKILKNDAKLTKLKSITGKREASVFVNGGVFREIKQMLIILAVVGVWFYF